MSERTTSTKQTLKVLISKVNPLKHIAFATCRDLPGHEHDDEDFYALCQATEGLSVAHPIWDDPGVDWSSYDLVVIRTTWDYTKRFDAFLEWAREVSSVSKLRNTIDIIEWNGHKSYLRDLELGGVPIVPTIWFDRGESEHEAFDHAIAELRAAHAHATRGFFKPCVGANSSGTRRFSLTDEEELAHAFQAFVEENAHHAMMLQPYRAEVESHGEISLLFFDGVFSHALRKIPKQGDYRVQDDWGARDEPLTLEGDLGEALLAMCKRCMEVTRQMTGHLPLYARVDLLPSDTSGERFEVNELELIEPSLFWRHAPAASMQRFLDLLLKAMETAG